MARFYADEQFPLPVVKMLRTLGHDILTVQEANKAEQKIPYDQVLSYAIGLDRAVLTLNRHDFIVCTNKIPNIKELLFVKALLTGNRQHKEYMKQLRLLRHC